MQANNMWMFDENTPFVKESQNPVIFAPFLTDFIYMKTWLTFFALLLCSSALFAQTANITSGCIPLLVDFTPPPGSSTFFWDFKDGGTSTLQNPAHNFVTPGTYEVEFKESETGPVIGTVTINVYDIPALLDLVADPATGCPPADVSLEALIDIDPAINISRYVWVFGDGQTDFTTSNTTNHTYNQAGAYTISISLTTDQPGCDLTLNAPNAVQLSTPPPASFTVDTMSACVAPLTVTFTNTTPDDPDYLYEWNFDNGTLSVDRDPGSITFDAIGQYNVVLTVTDVGGCSATVSQLINVGPPVVDLTYPDTVCTFAPFTIRNNNETDNAVWDFGPNGTGNVIAGTNDYQVTFNQQGLQTVTVTLTSPDGQCTSDSTFTILADQADASFVSVPTFSCNKTLTATFTPNTSVDGATYEWTFQGGDTDTVFAPTYTYENMDTTTHSINGRLTFDTRLRVTNPSGCVATFVVTDTIHQPNALFAIDDIRGCAPLTVTFSDSSSSFSPLTEWFWDFGDGNSETRNDNGDVTYTYTTPGDYDARLIVTNQNGCMDTSYVIQILVGDQISGVDFGADQTTVCPGDTVRFSDLTNDPNIDAWHFETDGGRSFHCYQDPNLAWTFDSETGSMDVSLTVEYNGCFTTVTKDDFITVNGPIAQLDYEIDCANPFEVSFRDSSDQATSVLWQFGSDTIGMSMARDTMFTFPDTGAYVVKLFATNGTSGCPVSVDSTIVYIRDIKADITLDTILCIGQEYQLDASLSEGVDADCWKGYTWFFPQVERPITTQDSSITHMFNNPGTQTVELIVEDINGCEDTATLDVEVFGIYPDLTVDDPSICNPATVQFGNATTSDTTIVAIEWSFGDVAMGMSTDSLPMYTYTTPPAGGAGAYDVEVLFEDAVGCPGGGNITINWYEPVSVISSDPGLCIGDDITFTASDFTSEGSFLTYSWDFGGGTPNTSTQQTETVTYDSQTGDVLVRLQFTEDGSGCMGDTSTTITIHDFPIADLSADQDTTSQLCPGNIVFVDESTSNFPPLTQTWNFGNSPITVTGDTVVANYDVGTYVLELIVATEFGCADTTIRNLEVVGPTGDFVYAPLAICLGDPIVFALRDTQDVVSWVWDFGDGTTITDQDSVTHIYNFVPPSGRQPVSLTLTGPRGCTNIITGIVNIQNTTANFGTTTVNGDNDTEFCIGETVIFSDSSLVADIYSWDFGDGTTNTTPGSTSHTYSTAGTFTIRLEVSDAVLGCNSVLERQITVSESPVAELTGPSTACAGLPSTLTVGNYDPSVNDYVIGPLGTIDNQGSVPITISSTTTFTLVVTDITNGCISTASLTVDTVGALGPKLVQQIDTSRCPGDILEIDISFSDPTPLPSGITYTWSGTGVGSLSCTDCANPTYTAPAQGQVASESITVVVDPNNGCPTESTTYNISISEGEFLSMPNSFTPDNGDDLNDFFQYEFEEEEDRDKPVTVQRFQIFNRFGQMVYDNDTPDTGWDGMQDGEQAPSDTYVYIIEIILDNCLVAKAKGNVMLIR